MTPFRTPSFPRLTAEDFEPWLEAPVTPAIAPVASRTSAAMASSRFVMFPPLRQAAALDPMLEKSVRPASPFRHRPIEVKPKTGLALQVEVGSGVTGATGLEPATSGVTGRRSNQLNYAPGNAAV